MSLEELRSRLDAKIPRSVVSVREGKYHYLEGWFVIDRLNQVLGQGNWNYEIVKLEKTYETQIEKNGKKGRALSYLATIKLSGVLTEGRSFAFIDVGAGKGIDYGIGTDADESAAKEAVTDGVKRCAKNLGMSFGLALYDKNQTFVSDEEPRGVKPGIPDPAGGDGNTTIPDSMLEFGKWAGRHVQEIDIKELDEYYQRLETGIKEQNAAVMRNYEKACNTLDKIGCYLSEYEVRMK